MRSLQARLGVAVVVSVVLLFAAQWLMVNKTLLDLTENYFTSRLEHDMDGLLAALDFDKEGRPFLSKTQPDPIFHNPFSGHYFEILVAGEVIRSRSLWNGKLDIAAVAIGSNQMTRMPGPQGQDLVLLRAGFKKRGHAVTIGVAEDYSPIAQQFRGFQWGYLSISVGALLGLILLQVWLVRMSLRPLDQLRADMRRLEQGGIRQLNAQVPAEVAPLVTELNRLITVLGQRLERSRNALGNLAHALKTPLTGFNQLLNSAELNRYPQLRAQMYAQSDTIGRLIQRELKRARLAGGAAPGQRFDPERELPPLLAMFEKIYQEKSIEVRGVIPSGPQRAAEREDMLELFGNLLDNACKWAARRVLLTIEDKPGLVFSVEDDGPGAPAEAIARLTGRGMRADESVSGYGLGLAIAKEVVEHYGGRIGFERSPLLGGFRVWVAIPAQGTPTAE